MNEYKIKPGIRLDAAETARAATIVEILQLIAGETCGHMRCTCNDDEQCRTFAILIEKIKKAIK